MKRRQNINELLPIAYFTISTLKTHGSLIFLSNELVKPIATAEYSPISLEQTGLCVGFARN